jgi:quercetin dioxygenase-like cupin family protein
MSDSVEQLDDGVTVEHTFCEGVYCKTTRIPANTALEQHTHPFDHISILSSGEVFVVVGNKTARYSSPEVIVIKANKAHTVIAVSDVVWCCIHRTDETDPAKVDQAILKG